MGRSSRTVLKRLHAGWLSNRTQVPAQVPSEQVPSLRGGRTALSAPLGLPHAGAGSERALALPGAGSHASRQPPLSARLLAGARDPDPHAAVGEDVTLEIDRSTAVIDDVTVSDPHPVPVGAVAAAALRHDDDAPITVEGGGDRRRRSRPGRDRGGDALVGWGDIRRHDLGRRRNLCGTPGDRGRCGRRLAEIALPDASAIELNRHPVRGEQRAFVPIVGPNVAAPIDPGERGLAGFVQQVQIPSVLGDQSSVDETLRHPHCPAAKLLSVRRTEDAAGRFGTRE